MKISEVIQLQPGDDVFWNDPDDDLASRWYFIEEIDIEDGVVRITDVDGSYLECYASELSLQSQRG